MADVRLRVSGVEYAGWKSARIIRGIESIAGGFELSVSDRWAGQDRPWPITTGTECVLLLDGEPVVTGYVDRRSVSYEAQSHTMEVAGRDRTAALVDCSAVAGAWEFRGITLLDFARRIAEPLGVRVTMAPGIPLPKIAKFSIDPGDGAFDTIERACRRCGVLPVADDKGNLLLTRAGAGRATTALVEGENILAASIDDDTTGRFRRYIVAGQRQGSDEDHGAGAAAVRGEAEDEGEPRVERVLMIQAEGSVTPELAKARAQWEAIVRAGRGTAATVRVAGWTQGDGSLWPVNALVPVESRMLGLRGEMLITQAVYSLDDGGTVTTLRLMRPDAFLPEPVVAPPAKPKNEWPELRR